MSKTISKIASKLTNTFSDNSGKTGTAIAGMVVFIIGIGLTLFVIVNPMKVGLFEIVKQTLMPQEEGAAPGDTGGRKVLYWYAPMDPTYIMDKPGKSPMGMDLLPKYADEAGESADNAIRIDPATVQNIGVTSEPVRRGNLKVDIRTVGNLGYNEKNVVWVTTKYDGWIEKVYVNYIGERVEKGKPLFEIYSPDLVSTQEEYLSAVKYLDKMKGTGFDDAEARARNLLAASRGRLLYWDISDKQIRNLEKTGTVTRTLTVVSPVTGIVVQKMGTDQALEGMYVKPGMNLYKVADLSSLWLYVDLYEYQLPWIKIGQEASVEISYYPGETFVGKVLYFYPSLDEKTRTVRASIEVPNADGKLRPEMFATVNFTPVAAKDAVLVPGTAVLHSGKRDVVVLDLGDGRFEPRDVKLGLQGEGQYQVLEGLEGDEQIVTSSQFLIDSESNLKEAINKMLMAKKGEPASPEMAPMEQGSATKSMDQGSGTKTMKQGSDTKGMQQGSGTKMMEQGSATKNMDQGSGTKAMEQGSATKETADPENEMKPAVTDPATVQALDTILKAYLPIWKTLAADSTKGIDENAKAIATAAGETAEKVESEMLKKQLETLKTAAANMKSNDLKQARESMKGLSRALIAIFQSHDVKMPDHYTILHCPMVNEDWIQNVEQVMNPYYGSAMLTCGVRTGEIG